MRQIKVECGLCTPQETKTLAPAVHKDWEMHPSWIAGMEALNSYSEWVSSIVLPIAFQWIEEHKPEVYASVPPELKDDVGVVLASAFKLIKELPAYQSGQKKSAAYEEAMVSGKWNPAKTNPVWAGIVKKVRAATNEAFAAQSDVLGDSTK